jgi:MYXO-CTERM domain-containing protein
MCDGSRLVTLPDGREVFFPADEPFVWPEFQDEMPWEEDVDQEGMADNAPLVNLVDKTDEINKLLDEYNKQKGYGDIPTGCTMCSVGAGGSLGGIAFGLAMLGMLGLVRRRHRAD